MTVKVNGKTYKGSSVETTGSTIRLIQTSGYVSINLDSGVVVEVAGVQDPTPGTTTTGGPRISGSRQAIFNGRRNASLEGILALPGDYDTDS